MGRPTRPDEGQVKLLADIRKAGGVKSIGSWAHCAIRLDGLKKRGWVEATPDGLSVRLTRKGVMAYNRLTSAA